MEIEFRREGGNPHKGIPELQFSPSCPNGKKKTTYTRRASTENGVKSFITIQHEEDVMVGSESCIACSYCGGYHQAKGKYYMTCRFKKGDLFND